MDLIFAYMDKKESFGDPQAIGEAMNKSFGAFKSGFSTYSAKGVYFGFPSASDADKNNNFFHDQTTHVVVLFIGRLDNRAELSHSLGVSKNNLGDAELISLLHRTSGEAGLAKIYGDFALIIWQKEQPMLAVRDALGIYPLYFYEDDHKVVVASAIAQIFKLQDINAQINVGAIMELLSDNYQDSERTYFSRVWRIRAGCYLSISPSGIEQIRYWFPPVTTLNFSNENDVFSQFRALLRQAVIARLEASKCALVQLSGGLDSSSIACLIDEAEKTTPTKGTGNIYLFSARYPQIGCDEIEFIDAVRKQLDIPSIDWSPLDAGYPTNEQFELSSPLQCWSSDLQTGVRESVESKNCDYVFAGVGADELLYEKGYLKDLFRTGKLIALARELWFLSEELKHRPTEVLKRWIYALSPGWIKKIYHALKLGRQARELNWLLSRDLDSTGKSRFGETENLNFHSKTQQITWSRITSARFSDTLDRLQSIALKDGYSLALPFLDRRVVEFILKLPAKFRLPTGQNKRILRCSFENTLPKAVIARLQHSDYSSLYTWQTRNNIIRIRDLLTNPECLIGKYVSISKCLEMLNNYEQSNRVSYFNSTMLRRFLDLELWLSRMIDREYL